MKRSHQKSPRCGHQVESDRVPPVIKMLVLGNENPAMDVETVIDAQMTSAASIGALGA
jgi:hypothetical protein